jgi:predicted ATPase
VVEEHFLQALDRAHRQGALSWELRAATSLARLRHQQDRTTDNVDMSGYPSLTASCLNLAFASWFISYEFGPKNPLCSKADV